MDGEMSITFNACPENPYDLGTLVDSWKLRVCEKINNSGNIVKQDGLTVLMQLNETEYNCKGKAYMIFILRFHKIKYDVYFISQSKKLFQSLAPNFQLNQLDPDYIQFQIFPLHSKCSHDSSSRFRLHRIYICIKILD